MLVPDIDQLEAMASALYITVQVPKGTKLNSTQAVPIAKWQMNDVQREILAAILANDRVLNLKYRQAGSSTACCLALLGFAIMNPGVPVAIVCDTRSSAKGLLAKVSDWCSQLDIGWEGNKTSIKLENGTEIDALSAISRAEGSESKVGRSRSYGFLLCSEVAFWDNAEAVFRGLTSTALPDARIVCESTASAADNLWKKLYTEDEEDQWHRIFLSVERSHAYKADPDSLAPETWLMLQESKYSFLSRETAAWWWIRCRTDFAGDVVGCLREYPVVPRHCFETASGMWAKPSKNAEIEEQAPIIGGRYHGLTRYVIDNEEPVVMGCDTGGGLGRDASGITVMGLHSKHIKCTWTSATTSIPDYIEVIKDLYERYKPIKVIIESNGIGIGPYMTLKQIAKLPVVEQRSGAEKHMRLQAMALALSDGIIPVGPEIRWECSNSRIAKPAGPRSQVDYCGRDDLLNSVSFCTSFIEANAPKSSPVDLLKRLDPRQVFHRSFLKTKRKECF